MRRTLKIYRNAWTRFGNCPDNPLPVLPQSDDGGKNWNCRFSTLQGRAGSVFSCEAGTIAFVKRTRSQPRLRGCSRGLGCYPNKQRNRHPAATPDVCFVHLYIQMPCLPSSATADSQALLLIIFLLLFHQSGITKELFPGRNSQFVVDILVVKL